ncbi:MAG: hypothetical protein Udaeo2_28900 [Candidatus Udaeobacter sp.]|jgi:hypothetical protein|nr:MAG: hypothetical protein Udaeo2_28900 [Candidatus Udaeobacter sp.]
MFWLPHSLARRLRPREMMIAKMPSNYILWGLILIAILALLWLLYCNYLLPHFAAWFDTRCRWQTVKRFMAENPQSADESRHEYMRRVHWAVLTTHGLPPLRIVKIWLRSNKYGAGNDLTWRSRLCVAIVRIKVTLEKQ